MSWLVSLFQKTKSTWMFHKIQIQIFENCLPLSLTCKEFKKGESGLFLTLVLMLWGGGHIARHVWRWVIVPLDLILSFGATCAHYRYRVIHRAITNMMRDLSPFWKGHSRLTKLFGELSYKKSGGTITHLHMWRQDGCHNRFPLSISLLTCFFPVLVVYLTMQKMLCGRNNKVINPNVLFCFFILISSIYYFRL